MDTADKSFQIIEGLVVRGPVNGRRTYSKAAKQALVTATPKQHLAESLPEPYRLSPQTLATLSPIPALEREKSVRYVATILQSDRLNIEWVTMLVTVFRESSDAAAGKEW